MNVWIQNTAKKLLREYIFWISDYEIVNNDIFIYEQTVYDPI